MELTLFVGAVVLFVIALILVVWAMREHASQVKPKKQAQALAKKVTEAAQELERVQSDLEQVRDERDLIRQQFEDFVRFLVQAGVLSAGLDPLTVSDEDLIYEVSGPVPTLPEVSTLSRGKVLEALRYAANREDPRADRPFSRRYMVDNDGPLTRPELEALRTVLLVGGFLAEPEKSRMGYPLTDKGTSLLKDVKRGLYADKPQDVLG
jgi:Na+-transporting methylmalonyl-CoA/oxaloacetate decarboxylase gamma subunit